MTSTGARKMKNNMKPETIWQLSLFIPFILVICLLFDITPAYTQDKNLNLRWAANDEPDLEGYEIHYAPIGDGLDSITVKKVILKLKGVTATRAYDEELSSNTHPHYTLKHLENSVKYVIALKAYDNKGLVSDFSRKCSEGHGCDESSGAMNSGGGGGSRRGCFIWEAVRKDTYF